jgi:hypothetical protein
VIPLPVGEWRQLTITYQDATGADTSDGVMNVYTNGNQAPFLTFPDQPVWMAEPPGADLSHVVAFCIAAAWEPERGFNGDIAMIRIYNAELTPAQVEQNFNTYADLYGLGAGGETLPGAVAYTVTDQQGFLFSSDPDWLYELEGSDDGVNFTFTGAIVRGDGSDRVMFDPRGGPLQAHYQIIRKAP